MKKCIAFLLFGIFISGAAIAQDPGKDFKAGEKSLRKFVSDETKVGDLNEGMNLIKSAFSNEEFASVAKNWIAKGEVLNEVANAEFKRKTIDPNYQLASENAAIKAFKAFDKAASLTTKKNELKAIENSVIENESHLNNFAIFAYQVQDYATAFDNFSTSIKAYDLMNEMGKTSRLAEGQLLSDQYFFTAVSGYYSQKFEETGPYLVKLDEMGKEEPFIYEALFTIHADSDADKATMYLEKGRSKFPDDTGLLFAEINFYLKQGKLDVLISKLELAIEKEPDNISIYTTLGSVYDQLHQQSREAGDEEKAVEYFDKALDYYNQVLAKDDTNFDATYSVGALYYNKAATYVEALNDLAADLSVAGMKKYDATKAEMDALFEQALPYFEKAEKMDGNDMNTLIALKEIFARLNDLEKSESYKARIEALQGGE
ncbi:MAG: hypothetical protein HKN09_09510 [Saprospiraceae bacterium]|nr:hypothetical protein [Saprospiraceae bacterium]